MNWKEVDRALNCLYDFSGQWAPEEDYEGPRDDSPVDSDTIEAAITYARATASMGTAAPMEIAVNPYKQVLMAWHDISILISGDGDNCTVLYKRGDQDEESVTLSLAKLALFATRN